MAGEGDGNEQLQEEGMVKQTSAQGGQPGTSEQSHGADPEWADRAACTLSWTHNPAGLLGPGETRPSLASTGARGGLAADK